MPAVTDSSTELTYFANCYTMGLLAITYPLRPDIRDQHGAAAVLGSADNSSGFHVISGQCGFGAPEEPGARLQNCSLSTEL